MTLIVITHTPWVVAEYAERVLLLAHGCLLFDGALRELFAQQDLLERCHFRAPDVTRLGRHLGLTPLSIDELLGSVTLSAEP
jgi:energy-coupling factor transport system ATP-binding protein